MLDWLTLKVDICELNDYARERLQRSQSRIFCLDSDGSLVWERTGRKTVRSDSHQITMEMDSHFTIYGSPARVGLERVDNVFGSGDPVECAGRMIRFVEQCHGVQLPDYTKWKCTRMDVTHNYHLGELSNVLTALEMLRNVEGGRYQLQTSAETVYWSPRSTRRSGKAYAKGPHMQYLAKRGRAFLTPEEMHDVNGLLRLELSLKRHFFARTIGKPWFELSAAELEAEHEAYFAELVGKVEINEMSDMRQQCIEAAQRLGLTEGLGRAAYLSWNSIRSVGFATWKADTPKATFYRHKKIMQEAGLSYADFRARNVVPIRRRRIELDQPVRSWAELRQVA